MADQKTGSMEHLAKGAAVALLLALVCALALPTWAWAVEGSKDSGKKPKDQVEEEVAVQDEDQEEATFYGYRPIPHYVPSIHDANEGSYPTPNLYSLRTAIPSSYRSSDSVLTPIKDQNPFGTCWTFSVIAASESSILSHGTVLPGTVPDLSERHLAYFTYNPVDDPLGNLAGDTVTSSSMYLDQGGNERLASYTLASWAGAVDESTAPYSELVSAYRSASSTSAFLEATSLDATLSREHDVAHLTQMRQIPMTDRDEVKRAIMEYGAVDAAVLYDDDYYNDETNALYNNEVHSTNHAIALVGWDDSFSKDNFGDVTYKQPYGQYDLPSEYGTLAEGVGVQVSGPADGNQPWLLFEPAESGTYTIYSTGNSGDPYAYLYMLDAASGTLVSLGSDDDGAGDRNFSITQRFEAGKSYYLLCDAYSGSASYTVHVSKMGGDDGDDGVEPPSQATQISLDTSVSVQTGDWLVFTPPEDATYRFYSFDNDGDPLGVLYATMSDSGMLSEIASNDDGPNDTNFSLTSSLTAGNQYYLECSAYSGASASYSVQVEVYGDYDSGGDDGLEPPSSYVDIYEGTPLAIETEAWLRFEPSVTGTYTFWSSDYSNDPLATLYEVNPSSGLMTSLLQNDDDGEERNFSITYVLTAGKTYFLQCSSWGGDADAYTVQVAQGSGSGSGSGGMTPPAQATVLAPDAPAYVEVNPTTTVWYRFSPKKDGNYVFTGSVDGGYSVDIYGLDSSNGLLGYISGSSTSAWSSTVPDSYTLSVNLRSDITYYVECAAGVGESFGLKVTYGGEAVANTPSEDGAWLVRNSWGEEMNDGGYFWASYEDYGLNGSEEYPGVATTFEYGPADNFDNIYQYDGTCSIAYTWLSSGGAAANIFTAKANPGGIELLRAVSFWMEDANVDYSIQVYTGLTDDEDPTSGTAQLSSPVTGKTDYEGYYTVELPSAVRLTEGELYSVVVTVSHADGSYVNFGFDESGDYGWVSFTSNAQPGQSFCKDGPNDFWHDTSAAWSVRGNVRIKAFTSNAQAGELISIASATLSYTKQWEYTGSAIRPPVTVTLNGSTLRSGTDYTASYTNNTRVGTATITVTGRGEYTGTASGTFTIAKAKVTAPTARTGLTYTGQAQTGVATGTGYTLSGTYSATNAGSYTATATLSDTSNYTWSDGTTAPKTISWTIAAANISSATVATIANQTYTGSQLTPKPTVRMGTTTLVENTDYTLSYRNNVNPGTATITITGRGNYTGTKTATFEIVERGAIDISAATVSTISAQVYTGSPIEPRPTVRLDGLTLTKDYDYTLSYRNNVNPGTATITITGKGSYTGTKSLTFRVAEPFRDVTSRTSHYDDILWLYSSGVSQGWGSYPNREFRGTSTVKRQDMAAFLYRLAGSPDYTPTAADRAYFSDVNSSTPHAKEIWWLASTGVSAGWKMTDGTHQFRPMNTVIRQDMAAFLYRLAGSPAYTPTAADRAYFSDVNPSTPHAKEIWWLASTGVSTGWPVGSTHQFRGTNTVMRQDMAAFLHRMYDYGLV